MEDVVFVSEKALGKRKRNDDGDDAERKCVQLKDESESGNEDAANVQNAMSTVRINEHPQATLSVSSLLARIQARDQSITSQDMEVVLKSPQREMFEWHLRDAYITELELPIMMRKIGDGGERNALKRPLREEQFKDHVLKLERMIKNCLKKDDPVRLALESFSKLKKAWPASALVQRINILRKTTPPSALPEAHEGALRYYFRSKSTTNNTSQSPGVQGEQFRSGGVGQGAVANTHAMQQEIQALKSELEREKKAGQEAARDAHVAEMKNAAASSQRIKDKHMLLEVQRKAQQDLVSKLQRYEAEIADLRSSRTAGRDRKAVEEAQEAVKTAQAKTSAMYEHYDSVQNKNTVLIGKMRMMAKAGGFDGPNTSFRKELDSLRAPELTELDEYDEQEEQE